MKQAVLIFAALCMILAVDAQFTSSEWISDLGSFDLGIESRKHQICDESLGKCGGFDEEEGDGHGRLLSRVRYYISYGALAANRVPCPPRSGRSYYTPNCYRASGPVRPYHRGCTAVTRCYRDTS